MENPIKNQKSDNVDSANNDSLTDTREELMRESFSEIPRELALSWLNKYEDAIDEEAQLTVLDQFEAFMIARTEKVTLGDFDIHPDLDEESKKEIIKDLKKVIKSVREAYKNPDLFLGNGATAEVYSIKINKGICVKFISNQENYNNNNHLSKEYDFLDELHDFELNNIRTPKPYFLRIHRSEGHSYGMEKIDGNDLSCIKNEPQKNLELIKIMKKFDQKETIESFVEYVKTLHSEHKIIHNDIALRNIMIDKEGFLYLIDFGKSRKEEFGESFDILKNSDIAKVKSELTMFFASIDKFTISDTILED